MKFSTMRRPILGLRILGPCTVGLCIVALSGAMAGCAGPTAQQKPLSFGAMGDGPRGDTEWPVLARQVAAESAHPQSAFLIHLGDIAKGSQALPEWYYAGVAALLKTSHKPVYVVLGDNEWNDLEDPAIGWRHWQKYFEGFHRNFDNAPATRTQPAQPDNFAFVQNGVLVIGLNIVGGKVHDQADWTRRHKHDMAWVDECLERYGPKVRAAVVCAQASPNEAKNGDFFTPFVARVAAFEKPVLYLHGDGHVYKLVSPWRVPNLVRAQVDAVGTNPPLLVTVTEDPDVPFTFDRRIGP